MYELEEAIQFKLCLCPSGNAYRFLTQNVIMASTCSYLAIHLV